MGSVFDKTFIILFTKDTSYQFQQQFKYLKHQIILYFFLDYISVNINIVRVLKCANINLKNYFPVKHFTWLEWGF